MMGARTGSGSSPERSRGGLDMPPPPPMPPRSPPRPVERDKPAADASDATGGSEALPARSVAWADQVTLGSLLPTLGRPSTDTVGSQPVPRLPPAAAPAQRQAAAPSLSLVPAAPPTAATPPPAGAPLAAALAASPASTLTSPSVNPPADAEVLDDGSRLYRLPSQCMRYTQRLNGTWKQWGPMPLPDGEGGGREPSSATALAAAKLELQESEGRAAQLQAALGQAARQGKAQCAQFEQRLLDMEAELAQTAALGGNERASMEIKRLRTRLQRVENEAADQRTEASVARAAREKSRAAMLAARRAAEASQKKVEALEAAASKTNKRDDAALVRWHSRAEDASAAQKAARRAVAAASEECLKLKEHIVEVEGALAKARGEASAYKHKLGRCESALQSVQRSLVVEKGGRDSAQAAQVEAEQQLAVLRVQETEWVRGHHEQVIATLRGQLEAQAVALMEGDARLDRTTGALSRAESEEQRLISLVQQEKDVAVEATTARMAAEVRLSETESSGSAAQAAIQEQLIQQEQLASQLEEELAQASADRRTAVETLAAQVESSVRLRDQLGELNAELAAAKTKASEAAINQAEIERLEERLALETAEAEAERERRQRRAADPLLWKADRLLNQLDHMDSVAEEEAHAAATAGASSSAEEQAAGITSNPNSWAAMAGVWHAVGMRSEGGMEEAWLQLAVDSDGRISGHEAPNRQTEACVLEGQCGEHHCRFTQTTADDVSIQWTARPQMEEGRMTDGLWEGAWTGTFEAVRVADAEPSSSAGVAGRPASSSVSIAGAIDAGLNSPSFSLDGNLRAGDRRRVSIDPRLAEAMQQDGVGFDEARFRLVQRQMQDAGIDPQSGLPLDPKAVVMSSPTKDNEQPQRSPARGLHGVETIPTSGDGSVSLTTAQTSLLSVEQEVQRLKDELATQKEAQRAECDTELARLQESHTRVVADMTAQQRAAQLQAQTAARIVKGAHARETAKLHGQLEAAWTLIYKLRQAQLLRGHDLSGIWRASGVDAKTKQQVAIQASIAHDVNSGSLSGGNLPGDAVEFTLKSGQVVGETMSFTTEFIDGQQVVGASACFAQASSELFGLWN
jgi:hypothetical protein